MVVFAATSVGQQSPFHLQISCMNLYESLSWLGGSHASDKAIYKHGQYSRNC